jgi:hypothetical protein
MKMKPFEEILDTIRREVSFGYTTIHIFRASELETQQVGYSVSPTGDLLTTDHGGGWLKSWIVIGNEDLCGDPIFIDSSQADFPVYTAMHGEGRWEAEQIAASLVGFGHALTAIAGIAEGRKYPVALENKPLTQPERAAALAEIQRHNPNVDLSFWQGLLTGLETGG